MVIYNAATRELTAKIVYYGPGLCGKTTNLKVLHDRLEPGTAGKLLNLQTQTDRTIYFDLLPVELGDIKGYKIRFQLATVPGQTAFNETRRVVLKGVDGIVFVADSQWTMLPKNLESWQNLKDNLKSNEISFEKIPVVIQYNKRDLADILAVDAMQEALGLSSYPFVEAVASAGRGVTETFKLISKLTFVDLLRRLQGRRAEEESAAAAAAAEEARQDDLQTWKDSLLKRDSQAAVQPPRLSRPLSLVPPVSDQAPFDTTELGREVDDEDDASPYAVPEPPGLEPGAPMELTPPSATIEMDAIGLDELEEAVEVPETLTEADELKEIEIEESTPFRAAEPPATPAFLPSETASTERLDLVEERLREAENRASREREAAERLDQAVASMRERVAATTEHLAALGERMLALEKGIAGLHEAIGSFVQRLPAVESAAERHARLEPEIQNVQSGLKAIEERLQSDSSRQRKDGDDVAMALRSLSEKAQTVDQQMAALSGRAGSHEEQLESLRRIADAVPRLEGQIATYAGQAGSHADQVAVLQRALEALPHLENQVASLASQTGTHADQMTGLLSAVDAVPNLESQVAVLLGMAERLSHLEAQIEGVLRQGHELEATFDEKTQQGRREAEDIRSQIAPLLEERVRRHESDALLFSEMDRLRESMAESLHDLAERLRHAVRK
jgi:signal recognition particle receptor subunit beta/predicted  nucleic acid-binding Zn-ribbon protein